MAKVRVIQTHFWDDDYVIKLDSIEKLLFLYLLTNPLTNVCGIYEISLRRISFDTGIDKDMVLNILKRFEQNKKIIYIKESWIYIKNFEKNQILNPSIKIGIEREKSLIPSDIIEVIDRLGTDWVQTGGYLTKLNLTKLNLTDKPNKTKKNIDIPDIFELINPSIVYADYSEKPSYTELINKFGEDKVLEMAKYAIKIKGQEFAPVVVSFQQLKYKWAQLESHKERNNKNNRLSEKARL